jgi:hypothetical protein
MLMSLLACLGGPDDGAADRRRTGVWRERMARLAGSTTAANRSFIP